MFFENGVLLYKQSILMVQTIILKAFKNFGKRRFGIGQFEAYSE